MRIRRLAALPAALALSVASVLGVSAGSATLGDVDVIHDLGVDGGVSFGWAVSELTDITGDGVTDLIVSDNGYNGNDGAAFVFSGASGELIHALTASGGGSLGYSIADAGDVDADGTADIVAGQPGGNAALVFSGATGELLLTLTSSTFEAIGTAVAAAGDLDGDGHDDVLVGATFSSFNGERAGRAYVFSGADGSVLRAIDGGQAGDRFGSATDWVADLDGDGVRDHVVGARDAGKWNDGAVWVYSGRTGAQLWHFRGPKQGSELASFFVAGLDDLNGDGTPDVYVGDYDATAKGARSGSAYVLSGADGSIIHFLRGDGAKDGFGPGREAGDMDGDGVQDLVIGSYSSRDAVRDGGKFQLVSGADGGTLATVVGTDPGHQLGFDAVGLGDVDGDGVPDVLVSAASGAKAYVISGASLLPGG